MHQFWPKTLIVKHREGETCLLRIEELSQVLFHHGDREHVGAGVPLEIEQDGLSQQGIGSPQQPVDKLPLNVIVLVNPVVVLSVRVFEEEWNAASDLLVIKVLLQLGQLHFFVVEKVVCPLSLHDVRLA